MQLFRRQAFAFIYLLDLLKKNRRWSLDGTFSSAARPWTQVLIIGCYAGNRLIVAVQALISGKKSSYYREVLDVVRRLVNPVQPAKLISDFEMSLLKAVRLIFPACHLTGCNFHFAQALYRKAKGMGIFKLFGGDEDEASQRRLVYKTFRSVLSLALIPPEHVRRAFMLIVGYSVPGLQGWLGYFARNYIGLSQLEKDRGAAAFDLLRVFLRRSRSTERFSTPSTIATPSPIATLSSMLSRQSRSSLRSANTLNATLPCRPSTLSSRSSFQLVQRWDMEIVQKPRYAIPFWNVFNRAQNAIERTNNGMESSHKYFAKDLNHHPSLSDYSAALLSDVDKQVDTARAVRLQHTNILDAANFDTDEGLIDAVHLLGLVMQGFVDGLRVPNEDEEENETSEEE